MKQLKRRTFFVRCGDEGLVFKEFNLKDYKNSIPSKYMTQKVECNSVIRLQIKENNE